MVAVASGFLEAARLQGHSLFRSGGWVRCGRCRARHRDGQLNAWAARVEQRLDDLTRGVAEAREGVQRVADAGVRSLTKVVEDSRAQLGNHEY